MAAVTYDKASSHLPRLHQARGRLARSGDRRRGVPRPGRTVRLRQVHLAAHARRARGHRPGLDPHRRPRRHARPPEGPRHRDGLPELRALPAHDRRREHGLRAQDRRPAQGRRSSSGSQEAAKILDLEEYLDRRPKALSGGQRQRVAMGRAIVRQPQVFCMDEPLSNLDAKLRVSTRTQIASLQRRLGITTVYVTHDQVEAMTMGDRVAVLKDGILQQVDTPRAMYDKPANVFVAGLHRLARDEPAAGRRWTATRCTSAAPRPASRARRPTRSAPPARSRSGSGPRTWTRSARARAGHRGGRRRGARRGRLRLRQHRDRRRAPPDHRARRRPHPARQGRRAAPRAARGPPAPVRRRHRRAHRDLIEQDHHRGPGTSWSRGRGASAGRERAARPAAAPRRAEDLGRRAQTGAAQQPGDADIVRACRPDEFGESLLRGDCPRSGAAAPCRARGPARRPRPAPPPGPRADRPVPDRGWQCRPRCRRRR